MKLPCDQLAVDRFECVGVMELSCDSVRSGPFGKKFAFGFERVVEIAAVHLNERTCLK